MPAPLDLILGAPIRVRILRALIDAGDVRRASDIAREIDATVAVVQRALAPLVRSTVVQSVGSGRGTVYRIATDHPLAPPLRALFAAEHARRVRLLDAARHAADALVPPPYALWLFGRSDGDSDYGNEVQLALVSPDDASTAHGQTLHVGLAALASELAVKTHVLSLGASDLLELAQENAPQWIAFVRDSRTLAGSPPDRLVEGLLSGRIG